MLGGSAGLRIEGMNLLGGLVLKLMTYISLGTGIEPVFSGCWRPTMKPACSNPYFKRLKGGFGHREWLGFEGHSIYLLIKNVGYW